MYVGSVYYFCKGIICLPAQLNQKVLCCRFYELRAGILGLERTVRGEEEDSKIMASRMAKASSEHRSCNSSSVASERVPVRPFKCSAALKPEISTREPSLSSATCRRSNTSLPNFQELVEENGALHYLHELLSLVVGLEPRPDSLGI